jgi:hypothetical protein
MSDGYGSFTNPNDTTPTPSSDQSSTSTTSKGTPWDPHSVPPATGGGGPHATAPHPPNVPGGNGSGNSNGTQVDTPSMKLFADNIGRLVDPVASLVSLLGSMAKVNAGGFHQGNQLALKVNGGTTTGLTDGFKKVMVNLQNTLMDTQSAMTKVAKDYETADELNKMDSTKMVNAMSKIKTDVGGIGTAAKTLPAT